MIELDRCAFLRLHSLIPDEALWGNVKLKEKSGSYTPVDECRFELPDPAVEICTDKMVVGVLRLQIEINTPLACFLGEEVPMNTITDVIATSVCSKKPEWLFDLKYSRNLQRIEFLPEWGQNSIVDEFNLESFDLSSLGVGGPFVWTGRFVSEGQPKVMRHNATLKA